MTLRCHACFVILSGTAAIGYLLKYPFKGDSHIHVALALERKRAQEPDSKQGVDEVRNYWGNDPPLS